MAQWEELFRAGTDLAAAGDHGRAVEKFRQAAELDDGFAELQHRWACSCSALKQGAEARSHFVAARDADALPFRADTHINASIRDAASEFEGRQVCLVDAEREFAADPRSRDGAAGDELFYEHVHFKPEGTYLLASRVFRQVVPLLPDEIRRRTSGPPDPPAAEACFQHLALTAYDRCCLGVVMWNMLEQAPFDGQYDHAARRAQRLDELDALEAEGLSRSGLEAARRCHTAALQSDPDDADYLRKFADLSGAAATGRRGAAVAAIGGPFPPLSRVPQRSGRRAGGTAEDGRGHCRVPGSHALEPLFGREDAPQHRHAPGQRRRLRRGCRGMPRGAGHRPANGRGRQRPGRVCLARAVWPRQRSSTVAALPLCRAWGRGTTAWRTCIPNRTGWRKRRSIFRKCWKSILAISTPIAIWRESLCGRGRRPSRWTRCAAWCASFPARRRPISSWRCPGGAGAAR